MVLEPFALLVPEPVHEEAHLAVDQQDRGDHQGTDPDGGEPGEEPEDEEDRSSEFGGHDEDGDQRRQAHLRETLDGGASAGSSKPPEDLLRPVGKEDDRETEAQHERRVILAGANECVCHFSSRPMMHRQGDGFQ